MSVSSEANAGGRTGRAGDDAAEHAFVGLAAGGGLEHVDLTLSRWSRAGRDPVAPLKWTFAVILAVIVVTSILSNLLRERDSMQSRLTELDRAAVDFLGEYERVQAAGLEKALVTLTANEAILSAFRARNRTALLTAAAPIFAQLRDRHGVTHFEFTDDRRVAFLRVHDPERHGDEIRRFTTLAAASSGTVSSGLEFGAYGGFTLRVVKPWIVDRELIGFLEIGIEIGQFLDAIEDALGITLVEAYSKTILDHDEWAALEGPHTRVSRWDLSDHYVLSANDFSAFPPEIIDFAERWIDEATADGQFFGSLDGAFHVSTIRLDDVAGREVGRLLAIREITTDILAFIVNQAAIIAVGLALWFAALGIFNRVAGRVQGIIADTQARLDGEVTARTRQLAASEQRYRDAQRIASFGNWERNLATNELYWSDEVYRIHGVALGTVDLSRGSLINFVHPDDRGRLIEAVDRAIRSRTRYSIDHRIVLPSGEVRYVHKQGMTEYGDDGTPLRMIGVVHDVTERRRMEAALRESEELFSQAFRRSPLNLSISDPVTGVVQDVNDTWLATLGYERDEVIGRTVEELGLWVDPEGRAGLVNRLSESDSLSACETKFRAKNGDVLDIVVSAGWVNSSGRRMIFVCSCDVTELRRAEIALHESERLLSEAFQLSPTLVAMSYCDDGKFCEVNEAWVRALGYTREEAIGHSSMELNVWVDYDQRNEIVAQVERWGSVHARETQLRAKSGEVLDILFSATLIKRDGRSILFGLSNDVTSLRKAEGHGRRLARMMEASLNEIYIFDAASFRFVHANRAAQDNLGLGMDELARFAPWDVAPEFDEARYLEMVEPLRAGDVEALRFETLHRRADGSTYAVEVQLQHYCEEKPAVFVSIANDISERKHAEVAVAELNQDLERRVEERTEELRVAHQHLLESEKMASLGGLVAGVAHEINTPIGIGVTAASHIHGQSIGLRDKLGAGTLRKSELEGYFDGCDEWTSILLSNLNRASDLVRSFKNVSVDQLIEDRREINFVGYVNDIVLSLRPKLKQTAVNVEVDGDPELALDTYPGAISQIVTNLTINSLMHAFSEDEDGLIRISASAGSDGITMLFSDNGQGIAREHLSRLFEPFFTTRRGQGGSGLGLNVVYNLVTQKLGGTIACESEPGEGTTFRIVMPYLT